jgi:ELWxxDGT repeat protein
LIEPGQDWIDLNQDYGAQLDDAFLFRVGGSDRYGLWRTDGSLSGTRQVAEWDHPVGIPSVVGDVAYLGVENQIWRTDGSAEGTTMVAEIGRTVSETRFLQAGDWILFTARSVHQGDQLWRTDGTADGTEMVTPLGSIGELIPLEDAVMFPCMVEGSNGFCVSDGSAEGTQQLLQLDGTLVSLGREYGALIFRWSGPDLLTVWHTDGTISGTKVTREISRRPEILSLYMHDSFHDQLLFSAVTSSSGRDLWLSDGTMAGTRIHTPDIRISWQQVVGERLFVVVGYRQLYVLDEPDGELVPLANFESITARYTATSDSLFFFVQEAPKPRLWTSDGTSWGTRPVSNLELSWNRDLAAIGDKVFLLGAVESDDPLALLRVDDDHRIVRVADLPVVANECSRLVPAGQSIFICCPSSLWRSDGTTDGTVQLAMPFADSDLYHPTPVGEELFLLGRRQQSWELWWTSGDQVVLVDDLTLAGQPAAPIYIWAPVVVGDLLFFPLLHQSTGQELWVSDGTPEGTRQVRDIYPGPRGSYPSSLTAVDDTLLFTADNGVRGYELWISDGSEAGTRMVTDIAPGRDASSPDQYMPVGPMVLFTAADRTARSLWAIPKEALQALSPRRPGGRTSLTGGSP